MPYKVKKEGCGASRESQRLVCGERTGAEPGGDTGGAEKHKQGHRQAGGKADKWNVASGAASKHLANRPDTQQ